MALITAHDILGNTRFIDECTDSDVPAHFELIKHWVPEEEHEQFQDRMRESVKQNRAYTMLNSNAFLYYEYKANKQTNGVALYGQENPVDLITLFTGVFGYIDTDVFIMYFKLHPGKFIEEYKSLITAISARRAAQDPNHPLAVRIDQIKSKIKSIYETRGYE